MFFAMIKKSSEISYLNFMCKSSDSYTAMTRFMFFSWTKLTI